MSTLEWILVGVVVIVIAITVIAFVSHVRSETPIRKAKKSFVKFLKEKGIKRRKVWKNVFKFLRLTFQKDEDQIKTLDRIKKSYAASGDFLLDMDNGLDVAFNVSKLKDSIGLSQLKEDSDDEYSIPDSDFDKFYRCFRFIRSVDETFEIDSMIKLYRVCRKKDVLEPVSRAWIDQVNADLGIDFDTAIEFISKERDFPLFVNLDILAKRSGIEIDEKYLINSVDDEGLKIIIQSLIRAKYEGVYLSESESMMIDKSNVIDYSDSFKVTVEILKTLYGMKRDVKRFTDVMIRAHNAGVNINFSMMDLYSLSDEQFDNLVSNVIKASNKGISIDQNDLIRQNIQGNDVTQLVKALIKANEYKLDITPDELMLYISTTHCDVVKFVKAYHYALEHKLPSEDGTPLSKDHLVEYSRPEADLYDYVKGLKIAKDVEKRCEEEFEDNLRLAREEGDMTEDELKELKPSSFDRGINYDNLKKHFIKFGSVMPVIEAIRLGDKNDLNLDFKLGTQICESEDWDLKLALNWGKTPTVDKVEPDVVCVTKDGIQITPKINATVRGKLALIFSGYGKDILYKRINEAVTMELETAENLDAILKTLPDISHRVLFRVNEENMHKEVKTGRVNESELNNVCRYDLLDVNIYDIVVGQDVKSELKLRQAEIDAEIRRLQAEADRAKAEADLRRAMVEQYEKGIKPNFNELHKANLLADKGENIITGYENAVD